MPQARAIDDLLRIQQLHQSGATSSAYKADRHTGSASAVVVAADAEERLRYAGNDAGAPAEDDAWALHYACEDVGRAAS